jgi:hypothetical protein
MRKIWAIVVGLTACGSNHSGQQVDAPSPDSPSPDAQVFLDAPPPALNFSCLNNSAPSTATATVTLSGTVDEGTASGGTPGVAALAGASVDVCVTGAANCTGGNHLGTTKTTDASGNFTSDALTGNTPVDAFLKITKTNYRQTFIYPPSPFVADQGMIPALTFTNTNFGLLTLVLSVTQSPTKGVVIVAATDCSAVPMPVANATITLKQGGSDIAGTTQVDLGTLTMGMFDGLVVFNVPAGATDVGASYNGMTFRTHTVNVVAASDTLTTVKPGY